MKSWDIRSTGEADVVDRRRLLLLLPLVDADAALRCAEAVADVLLLAGLCAALRPIGCVVRVRASVERHSDGRPALRAKLGKRGVPCL